MTSPALIDAMRRVSALLQAGDLSLAQTQLEAIVAANPEYVEGLRLLAGAQQALGDVEAAEKLLRRALELAPDWTPTLATLGELLLSGGRGSEAESAAAACGRGCAALSARSLPARPLLQ